MSDNPCRSKSNSDCDPIDVVVVSLSATVEVERIIEESGGNTLQKVGLPPCFVVFLAVVDERRTIEKLASATVLRSRLDSNDIAESGIN
jgi:hypothetical protein